MCPDDILSNGTLWFKWRQPRYESRNQLGRIESKQGLSQAVEREEERRVQRGAEQERCKYHGLLSSNIIEKSRQRRKLFHKDQTARQLAHEVLVFLLPVSGRKASGL